MVVARNPMRRMIKSVMMRPAPGILTPSLINPFSKRYLFTYLPRKLSANWKNSFNTKMVITNGIRTTRPVTKYLFICFNIPHLFLAYCGISPANPINARERSPAVINASGTPFKKPGTSTRSNLSLIVVNNIMAIP